MTFKIIATIQVILLTAALVHIVHLEGVLHNKEGNTTIFVHENGAPIINAQPQIQQTINKQLPPESYELLPDIQDVQDKILDNRSAQFNHSDALFGEMKES